MATFYSYQSFVDYKIDTLEQHHFWFTFPEYFNDTFECIPTFNFSPDFSLESLEEILPSVLKGKRSDYPFEDKSFHDLLRNMLNASSVSKEALLTSANFSQIYSRYLENVLAQIGVACFTPDCLSELMWGYYADSHQGFCLGFEFDLQELTRESYYLREMNYSKVRPQIDIWEALFTDISSKVIFTKSAAWRHEEEVRLMTRTPLADLIEPINPNGYGFKVNMPKGMKLKEIIRGFKMNQKNKADLEIIASSLSEKLNSQVMIKDVVPSHIKYALTTV